MGRARAIPAPPRPGVDLQVVLRALADGNRLKVFDALRGRERCVRDLVSESGLTQPLVSHHLRVLVEAGLVGARRSQGFTLYALDPAGLTAAHAAAARLLDPRALAPEAHPGGNPSCCAEPPLRGRAGPAA